MSLSWLVPEWDAPANVGALASTRADGVSGGPYAGLNLGSHVGDAPLSVAANRRLVAEHLPAEPLWLNQIHGTAVAIAEDASAGVTADACVTRTTNRVLAVLHADCLPILFCDDAARCERSCFCLRAKCRLDCSFFYQIGRACPGNPKAAGHKRKIRYFSHGQDRERGRR